MTTLIAQMGRAMGEAINRTITIGMMVLLGSWRELACPMCPKVYNKRAKSGWFRRHLRATGHWKVLE